MHYKCNDKHIADRTYPDYQHIRNALRSIDSLKKWK